MNCQEFWKSDAAESSHLAECARCRAAWNAENRLADALRSVRPELSSAEAPKRVESRLLAALRAQASLAQPRRPVWIDLVACASAAAAVAVVAVFLVRDRQPAAVPQSRPHVLELAVVAAPAGEAEATSEGEFIPLPNAAALEAGEESNLVRVELPRSAMIAMGFDVGDDDEDASIPADVMLGPDGLARAVRFLEE